MSGLDIRTLIAVLALVNVFLGVVMVLYWRSQRVYPGFALWTWCNVSLALVWILFFLRGRIPAGVSIVVPNALAVTAATLRLEGVRRFLGRPRFDFRMLAVPVVALAAVVVTTWVHPDAYIRTAVTLLPITALVGAMAWLALSRAPAEDRRTYWTIGLLWILYGVLLCSRSVYWLVVRQGNPLLEPIDLNTVFYVASILFDIAWTVVFLVMVNNRTGHELDEAREAAEQVLHSRRLESLGTMAAGVAHDFNNLLTVVQGNLDLALEALPKRSEAQGYIDEAITGAHRAAELTTRLRSYAGGDVYRFKEVDVHRLAEESVAGVASLVPEGVEMVLSPSPAECTVTGDPDHLRQALMFILANALESYRLPASGRTVVRTGSAYFDKARLATSSTETKPAPGTYAFVEVADSGSGMDAATAARMFDPFFSTRFTGRGLGLAAVLGVVQGHRGAIFVHSEASKGTTVTIALPA